MFIHAQGYHKILLKRIEGTLKVGCPQDTRAEREARCTTSSDSTLLADSELVFEFCVRPHMTEKIDF